MPAPTQGADASSLLLNGLSVAFFLEIDDLIPTIALRDTGVSRASELLSAAALDAYKHDRVVRSQMTGASLISAVLSIW